MKFYLEDLDCANCANEIEEELNKMDIVEEAVVNFSTKTAVIKLIENNNYNISLVKNKINEVEPDVKIYNSKDEVKLKVIDYDLIKIILSSILLILAFILKDYFVIQVCLFVISYIIVAFEIVFDAFKNLFKGNLFDENFLMMIATFGAFYIGEYSEAVAVMLLYNVGEFLQGKAVNKTRKSISKLMDIRSDYANLKTEDEIVKVDPNIIKIDDIIIVKPGEKVPLDGVVIKGSSFVDTVALTGESIPREVDINSEILSGMINKDGVLEIKVTKEFKDSTVSKILDLVENSMNSKSSSEKFITKFSKVYTPIVVLIAVLIAILPPLVSNMTFADSLYKALVCLVISCPCALVISVPLSYFAGIGCASKNGILFKGSNFLDEFNKVDTIVFDKTGTLTKGVFEVTKIVSVDKKYKDADLLKYAAYAENYSNHPIAKSVIKKFDKKIDDKLICDYKEIAGKGINVKVFDDEVLIGNEKLIEVDSVDEIGTILYIRINSKYVGYIVVSDIIKDDSKLLIQNLYNMNIQPIMLTGDNDLVAKKVASELKIKKYYSQLLPKDKVDKFLSLKKDSSCIAFVGDGINDAPVLATSDIGIAMGGVGSDSAIEASDVVIMTDEPSKILEGIRISNKTKKIVIENISFALAIKFSAMILGILGIAFIWEAVIADVGVTLLAVLNSLRCLNK